MANSHNCYQFLFADALLLFFTSTNRDASWTTRFVFKTIDQLRFLIVNMDKPYPSFHLDLFCHNPVCPKGKKRFQSERALTMHFTKSPLCRQFLHQTNLKNSILPNVQKGLNTNTQIACNISSDVKHMPQHLRRYHINMSYPVYDTVTSSQHNHAKNDYLLLGTESEDTASDVLFNNETTNICEPSANTAMIPIPEGICCDINQASFPYTIDQKWTISLLKLLKDMNAPDYAFGNILSWARAAQSENYSFQPKGGLSRNRNLACFTEAVQNAKLLLPTVISVTSPNNELMSCDVITFDFVPQLLRLLQNPQITNAETLVIDANNPLHRYDSNGIIGEAISGSVYNEAYDRLITDPSKQLFVPIIQWIDRTTVSGNERFSLKPYMFTPAIYTATFRRTIQAWGYHGYLPKPKVSSAQNAVQRQGDNIRNYHAQLGTVLETFRTANERLRNVRLPLGHTGSIVVDVVTCILFVIQDMQEGDQLCGRFGPHAARIQRQCRACDVSYEDLDNPQVNCHYLYSAPMHMIALETDDQQRARWSQHRLDNIFNKVPLADPLRGILGSTPVETMHAFRKGLIETVTFLVLENVPASKKAALDSLAINFHKNHRQTYRKAYPSTDFSSGITNLTKISAAERLGLVFLFVILSQYDEGWQILESTLKTALAPVIQVFEALLCFDAWLGKPIFWLKQNEIEAKRIAQASIRRLLEMCHENIPSEKQHPWKFPKFHELLHIVDDISRFGAPTNYSAQRPESLLIAAAKQPGRRAQKRHQGSTYELQAAQRLADSLLIDVLYDTVCSNTLPKDIPDDNNSIVLDTIKHGTGNATRARVLRWPNGGDETNVEFRYEVRWQTTSNLANLELDPFLITYLCSEFGDDVCICTEYVRDLYTFRCHPCYQSDGPIYDWLKIVFDDGSYPCRLASVVITNDINTPYKLIVQSTTTRTGISSTLLTEWHWAATYYTIDPDCIEGPCFVVTIKNDKSKVLETLPLQQWPDQFTDTNNL